MRLVYTATQQPVKVGDAVTVNGFPLVVARAPQPHKPDSEGRIDFNTPDGLPGPAYYCSVIGAEWIEREDRIQSPTGADAMSMAFARDPALILFGIDGASELMEQPYNTLCHICPVTGRVAMTVADAYAREDSADRTFWTYGPNAASDGLDPWLLIEGIDATSTTGEDGRPVRYDIFRPGRSHEVSPGFVVYMQRTKAEREDRAAA